ncbi:putative Acid phosphatase [Helianthus annuus]|nr:putative Acid phosphatase [Helianthus annuus]
MNTPTHYRWLLGNHDYRGNVLAQLSPVLSHKDSKWLCFRSFIVDSGTSTINTVQHSTNYHVHS